MTNSWDSGVTNDNSALRIPSAISEGRKFVVEQLCFSCVHWRTFCPFDSSIMNAGSVMYRIFKTFSTNSFFLLPRKGRIHWHKTALVRSFHTFVDVSLTFKIQIRIVPKHGLRQRFWMSRIGVPKRIHQQNGISIAFIDVEHNIFQGANRNPIGFGKKVDVMPVNLKQKRKLTSTTCLLEVVPLHFGQNLLCNNLAYFHFAKNLLCNNLAYFHFAKNLLCKLLGVLFLRQSRNWAHLVRSGIHCNKKKWIKTTFHLTIWDGWSKKTNNCWPCMHNWLEFWLKQWGTMKNSVLVSVTGKLSSRSWRPERRKGRTRTREKEISNEFVKCHIVQ